MNIIVGNLYVDNESNDPVKVLFSSTLIVYTRGKSGYEHTIAPELFREEFKPFDSRPKAGDTYQNARGTELNIIATPEGWVIWTFPEEIGVLRASAETLFVKEFVRFK